LIVVPSTAASYAIPNWIFGDFMCKTATYMVYVSTAFLIDILIFFYDIAHILLI
jgi:hypothetical protein